MAQYDLHVPDGMGEVLLGLVRGAADDQQPASCLQAPLQAAATKGDLMMVEALLKAGADCTGRSGQEGSTPLHAAATGGERTPRRGFQPVRARMHNVPC